MTQQQIVTTPANTGLGSSPKAAFDICNANFTDLYSQYVNTISVTSPPYNADPTGVADSTAAIQAADTAASAAGKYLYFPPGTYSIKVPVGANASAITGGGASWRAGSRDSTTLRSAAGTYQPGQRMISWTGLTGFTVESIGFDFSNATCAGSNGNVCSMLLAFQCTNWAFRDIKVTGISNYVLGVYANDNTAGNNWAVTDSYFQNLVPSGHQSQAINVQQSSVANQHQVSRNICIGTGIFSNGQNGLYNDNIVSGWGFGGGIVLGPNATCQTNRVVGNFCFSSLVPIDDNNTYPPGIECWSPYTQIIGNYCANCSGSGISVGGNNCTIDGNICLNNNQSTTGLAGISAYSISGFSASNCVYTGNVCTDNQGVKTQPYGYAEFGSVGTITGVIIGTDNNFTGNLSGTVALRAGTPGVGVTNGGVTVGGALVGASLVAPPAGGSAACGLQASSTANLGIYFGTGAPTFSAAQGSIYSNTTGAAGARLYTNTNGSTTWAAAASP